MGMIRVMFLLCIKRAASLFCKILNRGWCGRDNHGLVLVNWTRTG